jgi:hypothetical protein
MMFLIASVQSLLILQILTGSRFREPLAGFSKLLMTVRTQISGETVPLKWKLEASKCQQYHLPKEKMIFMNLEW